MPKFTGSAQQMSKVMPSPPLPLTAEMAAAVLKKVYDLWRTYSPDTVDNLTVGSVVYQDLDMEGPFKGVFEHSGIHIGGHKIVSLRGRGEVVEESTREFVQRGANRLMWASCRNDVAVGNSSVAKRAQDAIGQRREYDIVLDNCHMFTSGCLTGDPENEDRFLWKLKDTAKVVLHADNWRVWNRDGAIQRTCQEAIREISHDRRLLKKVIAADFKERKALLGDAFDRLEANYAINDVNGFLDGLAAIAKAYGGDLPWADFKSFDDWMRDDDTALKL